MKYKQAVLRKILSGDWTSFDFTNQSRHYKIKNFSSSEVLVSFEKNDVDEDQCFKILAGESEVVQISDRSGVKNQFVVNNNEGIYSSNTIFVKGTGEVEVQCLEGFEMIQDNVVPITVDITNGTYTGDTNLIQGGMARVTLSANTNFLLPEDITVTGASYQYNSTTGLVILYNLSSATQVLIEAECISVTLGLEVRVAQDSDGTFDGKYASDLQEDLTIGELDLLNCYQMSGIAKYVTNLEIDGQTYDGNFIMLFASADQDMVITARERNVSSYPIIVDAGKVVAKVESYGNIFEITATDPNTQRSYTLSYACTNVEKEPEPLPALLAFSVGQSITQGVTKLHVDTSVDDETINDWISGIPRSQSVSLVKIEEIPCLYAINEMATCSIYFHTSQNEVLLWSQSGLVDWATLDENGDITFDVSGEITEINTNLDWGNGTYFFKKD